MPTFQWLKQVTCHPSSAPMKWEAHTISNGENYGVMCKGDRFQEEWTWGIMMRLTIACVEHTWCAGTAPCASNTWFCWSLTKLRLGESTITPIFQWENLGSERLVAQIFTEVNGQADTQTQVCSAPKPVFFTLRFCWKNGHLWWKRNCQ